MNRKNRLVNRTAERLRLLSLFIGISAAMLMFFACASKEEDTAPIYTVAGKRVAKDSLYSGNSTSGFVMNVSYYDMVLSDSGQLTIIEEGGERFTISLFQDAEALIKAVEYGLYEKDLIIFSQVYDGRDEWGEVARVALQKRRVKWKKRFGTFNLSPAILHNRYLYGSTLGFVGKIDLKKGSIVWQKDDLWEKYKLNNFEKMALYQDTLMLLGTIYTMDNKTMRGKTVVFKYDKNSGREIKMPQ